MSKAVLLSIQPKWCELIVEGKKTIEVRKTRPKIKTPFKCYIYCTKPKQILRYVWGKKDYEGYGEPYTQMRDDEKVFCKVPDGSSAFCSPPYSGKVIGEFICKNIVEENGIGDIERKTGLSSKELIQYAKGKNLFAWFISGLQIYDKPKDLTDFHSPPETFCEKGLCGGCPYDERPNEYGEYSYDCEWKRPIRRAPRSWSYVEEEETTNRTPTSDTVEWISEL